MKLFMYALFTLIFNYILYNSFHWGEYGGAMAIYLVVPILVILSLILMFVHYLLVKKNIKTRYFQLIAMLIIIIVSYCIFPSQDSPLSIIQKMKTIKNHYNEITINDYFLENRFENYEKIVASKKKFQNQLSDISFSINISNYYNYNQLYKTFGINYFSNFPQSTNKEVNFQKLSKNKFKFTDYILGDTITLEGNKQEMNVCKLRTDAFTELGMGHFKDSTIKSVNVEKKIKDETPDERLLAYKFFYWFL